METLIKDLKILLSRFDEKKIDFRLIKENKFIQENSKELKQFLLKYNDFLEDSCKDKFNIEQIDLIKYLLKRTLNGYYHYKDKELNQIKETLDNEIWLDILLIKSYIHYNTLVNWFILSWTEEIDTIVENDIKSDWTWKEQFNIGLLKISVNLKNEKLKIRLKDWKEYNINIIDWNLSI